jgi:coenzyme F420 hydrogenase subunit beta
LADFLEEGIRPVVAAGDCGSCSFCLDVCPAFENDHTLANERLGTMQELKASFGPVLEIWEGHATDPEVRLAGSSGGMITSLCLYSLEKLGMHGVLHIGSDPDYPVRNKTTMSRTRQEVLSRTGSRYAPASACDRLDLVESAPAPCVFVGQPSEVTALVKAQALRPRLGEKVGLTISFFCAGTPATKGTLNLLKTQGINPAAVRELRYRGKGWPGHFAVTLRGQSAPTCEMTYDESWGFLQAYRPYSVHLCPDGTGEDADISCGDPWYRKERDGGPGSSLVIVRTERGREIVRGAIGSGYVCLESADAQKLVLSQGNLVAKRGAIWGRIVTMRALGLPVPKLRGFSLFKDWWRSSLRDKLRSTLGTARRVVARRYRKALQFEMMERG